MFSIPPKHPQTDPFGSKDGPKELTSASHRPPSAHQWGPFSNLNATCGSQGTKKLPLGAQYTPNRPQNAPILGPRHSKSDHKRLPAINLEPNMCPATFKKVSSELPKPNIQRPTHNTHHSTHDPSCQELQDTANSTQSTTQQKQTKRFSPPSTNWQVTLDPMTLDP